MPRAFCYGWEMENDDDPIFLLGEKSNDVRRLQEMLIIVGYRPYLGKLGSYDSNTQRAMQHYQKDWNLKRQDGLADAETLSMLLGKNPYRQPITPPLPHANTTPSVNLPFSPEVMNEINGIKKAHRGDWYSNIVYGL